MAASAPKSTAQWGRVFPDWSALLDFLRRELTPFPGRGVATGRIVIACVGVLALCMTLRVPEAHLAVWVVFKVALEEAGETLLTGVVGLAAITLGIAVSLLLLFVAMDQPTLRFCLLGVMAALGFFLRRTLAIGVVGFVLGLVSVLVLTEPDFLPVPELMVRLTLWLWPVFALGIAGAVAANLFIAPNDPVRLLRAELATRVRAAEGAIARRLGRPANEPAVARFATMGTARLLTLLRSAEILHPSVRRQHAQQVARITLVDRLVTGAAALEILSRDPAAIDRGRLEDVAAGCARMRRALDAGETLTPASPRAEHRLPPSHGSALLPAVVELEHTVAQLERALGPEPTAIAVGATERNTHGLFVADAFTNPEYARYAIKGALAVLICYLAQIAVDWPGIRTCVVTCMIVGLASEGATVQKGTLRIGGALVGAAMGFLAILVVVPNLESITSLALLVAAGSAVAAWVYVGSARISYAGVQIAFAFYVCVIQGFEPSWYLYTIRDRLIGILLGNTVITLVFLYVWPIRAGEAAWIGLGSALRAMANLATVGERSEDQAIVAGEIHGLRVQAYRHFASAQQSIEEDAFDWSTPGPDVIAARDRTRAFSADTQAVFLIQLAVASQRPNVAPAELPEGLVASTRRFDSALAESLDVIAERARSGASRAMPDLRAPLEALAGRMREDIPRIANTEVALQVEGRLALYRELVPRVERLGSAEPVR